VAPETPAPQAADSLAPETPETLTLVEASTPAAPGAIELWLMRNTAPLLIVFLALTAQLVVESLASVMKQAKVKKPIPAITVDGASPGKAARKAAPEAIDQVSFLKFETPPQVKMVLWFAIMIGCVLFCSPDARAFLSGVFFKVAQRPIPDLRIPDFLAVFLVYVAAARVLAVTLLSSFPLSDEAERAGALIINGLALSTALVAGIYLARHRARDVRGSDGIWPFWKPADGGTRSLWHDVVLGIAAYPPSVLLMSLCLYINHAIVYLLDRPQDEHVLISELAQPQSLTVLIIVFVMVTAGAAFFEELIFRGMIYNVMRRYFSAVIAACVAAFIFAMAHWIVSQILGLFVLALILTWLYDRTGRLVAGMTLHALNNLVALIVTLLYSHYR